MPNSEAPLALVTGGASGIGASVAARWVADGGRVGIIDVNEQAIDKIIAELGAGSAIGRVADVRSDAEVTEALNDIGQEFGGRLDAVVNSAGIAQPISAAEGADTDWVRMVDIHLNGTMRVCRASYRLLKQSERPAIVNISSVAGTNGLPGRTNYSAAKAGVEGLTRALAVEWSPSIRVNAVAPGYVQTAMIDRLVSDGKLDVGPVIARTPLARFAAADEIAAAITFLLSTQASFITGQTLRVDGGLTIEGNWYGAQVTESR